MGERTWTVYLAGEIHSDWRERIAAGVASAGLPVELTHPVTDHPASILRGRGPARGRHSGTTARGRRHAVSRLTLLGEADVVVVRFVEQYKQWNSAFDSASRALGTP